MPLTFPKSIRLQHSSEFLRVKTQGRAFSGRFMTVGVLKGCDATRVGLITSKRVGGAVERNRVRRRLRELMRLTRPQWVSGVWVVAIARHAAVNAPFAELQREWLKLAERAGILQNPQPKEGGGCV
ncbi:MAG: ribonuclease P protein component [Verrucomicrobia bacterium]|nr:ribonuclease P protein component [Verrucomicrobiota bacterium]